MEAISISTEEKIFDAARQEFIKKGLSGARMQSIAESAGVNKALIHYYFRTKERLYEAILNDMLKKVWSSIGGALKEIKDTEDIRLFIHALVQTLINTLLNYPDFPMMFLREFSDGGKYIPTVAEGLFETYGEIPKQVFLNLNKGIRQKKIIPLEPIHILISIIGMCVSGFLMKPMIGFMYKKFHNEIFNFDDSYLEKRIETITTIVCDGIIVGSK
jgi:AcrR family transcriptional regulator